MLSSGILVLAFILGCEQQGGLHSKNNVNPLRDLSRPCLRLIGHWQNEAGDNLYYGAVDPETQIGSFFIIRPDGSVAKHRYKILSEIPAGERVIVLLLFNDGTQRKEIYYIDKSGLSMKTEMKLSDVFISGKCRYVDAQVRPEKM